MTAKCVPTMLSTLPKRKHQVKIATIVLQKRLHCRMQIKIDTGKYKNLTERMRKLKNNRVFTCDLIKRLKGGWVQISSRPALQKEAPHQQPVAWEEILE